jgi:Flp pilus assembly pilin Flp
VVNILRRLATADSGVTALEYSLICAVIGLLLVVGLRDIGSAVNNVFWNLADALAGQ